MSRKIDYDKEREAFSKWATKGSTEKRRIEIEWVNNSLGRLYPVRHWRDSSGASMMNCQMGVEWGAWLGRASFPFQKSEGKV